MSDSVPQDVLITLTDLVREVSSAISMTMLDIGARPTKGIGEPFHQLIELFPGSRLIAFDPGKDISDSIMAEAQSSQTGGPVALGR